MKDKKKLVLLLICLIIITIICVTIIIILKKANTPNYEEHLVDDPIEIKEEFIEVNNNSYFYTIKGIMNDFVSYVKQVNGDQYLNLEKLNMTENEAKSRLQQEGIKTIGNYVFQKCNKLRNVELPESIENIGTGAFYICSNLQEIKIPDKVTVINNLTLYHSSNLDKFLA